MGVSSLNDLAVDGHVKHNQPTNHYLKMWYTLSVYWLQIHGLLAGYSTHTLVVTKVIDRDLSDKTMFIIVYQTGHWWYQANCSTLNRDLLSSNKVSSYIWQQLTFSKIICLDTSIVFIEFILSHSVYFGTMEINMGMQHIPHWIFFILLKLCWYWVCIPMPIEKYIWKKSRKGGGNNKLRGSKYEKYGYGWLRVST